MSELKTRINAAIKRITEGRAVMSIPADPRSDADIVLADCEKEIDRLNAALQSRRNAALEESARVCEHEGRPHTWASENADVYREYQRVCLRCAARIRALKSQEPK